MLLGIDRLVREPKLREPLKGKRVALLGHQASVTQDLIPTLDALASLPQVNLVAAFGPQHGIRGEKQDNMVESDDFVDPILKIPVWSLYGKSRRPQPEMLDSFDLLLVDLQDIGCRIYTYTTTLYYMLEACARAGKEVWVLDRPNPAGRPIEGSLLREGFESFVGLGPIPMRHGLTLGELAQWMIDHFDFELAFRNVTMTGYHPQVGPGWGWPLGELSWVNPSPNAASLSMARCFAGTVLIEGTELSEGRGTTRPLELVASPQLEVPALLKELVTFAPQALRGCRLRPCYIQPTFQKHVGKLCAGLQIHVDDPGYRHEEFTPYRLVAALLKAIKKVHPDLSLYRQFEYEYEKERLAFDLISGGDFLRHWIEDSQSDFSDLDSFLKRDEIQWREVVSKYIRYS